MRLCTTVKDLNGERVLIPGCMHAAVANIQRVSECVCREERADGKREARLKLERDLGNAVEVLGKRSVLKIVNEAIPASPPEGP